MLSICSPSLDNMPDLVIENVLKHADWKSVLILRQVSRRLRHQVDSTPDAFLPDNKLTTIHISAEKDQLEICFNGCAKIYYVIQDNGLFERYYRRKMVAFEGVNLMEMAAKDLEKVFRFQKSALKKFDMDLTKEMNNIFHTLPAALEIIFKLNFLKTATLISYGCEVMRILPYCDPVCLEKIHFVSCKVNSDLVEILKTAQWKTAKELYLCIDSEVPWQNLTHFSKIDLHRRNRISTQELDALRIALSNSPNFQYLSSYSTRISDFEQLFTLWGPSNRDRRLNRYFWYFRTRDRILRICLTVNNDDNFTVSIEYKNRAPNGVVIRDN